VVWSVFHALRSSGRATLAKNAHVFPPTTIKLTRGSGSHKGPLGGRRAPVSTAGLSSSAHPGYNRARAHRSPGIQRGSCESRVSQQPATEGYRRLSAGGSGTVGDREHLLRTDGQQRHREHRPEPTGERCRREKGASGTMDHGAKGRRGGLGRIGVREASGPFRSRPVLRVGAGPVRGLPAFPYHGSGRQRRLRQRGGCGQLMFRRSVVPACG